MAKSLSTDLRVRLISAVRGGMTRRAAAERFGVAAASAVRWVSEWKVTGATCAKPQGGDRRSGRIEACKDVILAAIEAQADITLVELADLLREQRGVSFAPSTIWRFLDRHDLTVKKKHTPASRRGPTSPRGARRGSTSSLTSIRSAWSSSMKPALRPRWPASTAAPNEARAADQPSRTGIGKLRPSPAPCASAA
jgi:transposase